jgi:hypothetical protein
MPRLNPAEPFGVVDEISASVSPSLATGPAEVAVFWVDLRVQLPVIPEAARGDDRLPVDSAVLFVDSRDANLLIGGERHSRLKAGIETSELPIDKDGAMEYAMCLDHEATLQALSWLLSDWRTDESQPQRMAPQMAAPVDGPELQDQLVDSAVLDWLFASSAGQP